MRIGETCCSWFGSAQTTVSHKLQNRGTVAEAPTITWNTQADAATYFSLALKPDWLKVATLVPVPYSKARNHADYDDRMARVCRGIDIGAPIDVRELIIQKESKTAAHELAVGEHRPTVAALMANYGIDEALTLPKPKVIGIFDDVQTVGSHFRAVSDVLKERWADVPIVGIFVARCVHLPPQF